MKKLMAFLLTLVLAFAIFGCNRKEEDVLPTSLKLKLAEQVEVGSSVKGTVTVSPSDATNKAVKWESSDPSIASVKDGTVTGMAAGKATITVTSEAAPNVKDSKEITVVAAQMEELKGISFSKETEAVAPGATIKVQVSFDPANATNKSLVWSSSDEAVATVVAGSKDGEALVTGVADGTCTITAKSAADESIFAELPLTVDESAAKIYVTKVAILTEGKTEIFETETIRYSVTFNDSDTSRRPSSTQLTWESSDPEVASVSSNGTITGLKAGTATIKCIAEGVEVGKEGTVFDEVTITVKAIVTPTSFVAKAVNDKLEPGQGTTVVIMVEPENGDRRATYESDNPEVAEVDENGNIKTFADKTGTANITVTSTADPTLSSTFTITVEKEDGGGEPESVAIKGESELFVGSSYSIRLMAVVLPAAAPQDVVWTSNNEAVATVDEFGNVTGVSMGTARIRATCKDYPDVKSPFFTVTVKEKQECFHFYRCHS